MGHRITVVFLTQELGGGADIEVMRYNGPPPSVGDLFHLDLEGSEYDVDLEVTCLIWEPRQAMIYTPGHDWDKPLPDSVPYVPGAFSAPAGSDQGAIVTVWLDPPRKHDQRPDPTTDGTPLPLPGDLKYLVAAEGGGA